MLSKQLYREVREVKKIWSIQYQTRKGEQKKQSDKMQTGAVVIPQIQSSPAQYHVT